MGQAIIQTDHPVHSQFVEDSVQRAWNSYASSGGPRELAPVGHRRAPREFVRATDAAPLLTPGHDNSMEGAAIRDIAPANSHSLPSTGGHNGR